MLRLVGLSTLRLSRLSTSPMLQVVKESDLIEAIQKSINCAKIEVNDISDGCGSNFMIDVVSDDFEGKRTVMRQQSSAICFSYYYQVAVLLIQRAKSL